MNVLAGYFSYTNRLDREKIMRRLIAFDTGSDAMESDYRTVVCELANGAVFQRYKETNPPLFEHQKDSSGNALFVKGFVYPETIAKYSQGLLHGCIEKSSDLLQKLEGEFVTVLLDQQRDQITIVNDRFGSRPFYILQDKDMVFFASNIALLCAMTGTRPGIDDLGWVQIFAYGNTIYEQTNCQGVQRIRSASCITISRSGLTRKRYWRLRYEPDYELDPDAYAEQVFEAFGRGVKLRANLKSQGILALSGGLDSRLIASGLSGNPGFNALTFIDSATCDDTAEVQAAALVAASLGITHNVESLSVGHVSNTARTLIKLNGGLIPLHHPAKTMALVNYLKRIGRHLLLGGGPGNNLSGGFVGERSYLNPKATHKIVAHYREQNRTAGYRTHETLASILNADFLEAYYPAAETMYRESFDTIEASTAAQIISAWEMMCGYPAFTSNTPIHGDSDIMEASAHLDYSYCDLMLKLPEHWLFRQRFYRHMIYRCIPETRDVIFANDGVCLTSQAEELSTAPDNFNVDGENFDINTSTANPSIANGCASYAKRIIRKIRSKMSNAQPEKPFVYTMLAKDKKLLSDLQDLIRSHDYLRKVVDGQKCDRYLKNINNGKLHFETYHQDAEILGSLASLCYMVDLHNSF